MLDDPRRKERFARGRGLVILVVFVGILALLAGGVGAYYTWATGSSGSKTKIANFVIQPGETGQQVANDLKSKGVIRSAFAFRLLAKFRGFGSGYEAGEYNNITTNMSVSDVLNALKQGPFVKSVRVGFAEGLTISQMAAVAAQHLGVNSKLFVKDATDGTFSLPPYLPVGAKSVEGFLFPETYDFLQNADDRQVIQRLLDQFKIEAARIQLAQRAGLVKMSPFQIVVIASMIEREARCDADRARVAAVIYNRLKKGMALQIDATVEYALGNNKPKLTTKDLQFPSPYNTYLHTGLPPAPIASPGLASLQAALAPAKANYLYYLVVPNSSCQYFTDNYQDFLNHKNG
jgi:UPF0755 protein